MTSLNKCRTYYKEQILLFTIWSDPPIWTDMCHESAVCSCSPSHLKQTEDLRLQQGWSPPLTTSLWAVWRCRLQPNSSAIRNTQTYLDFGAFGNVKWYINILNQPKVSLFAHALCYDVTWILMKRGLAYEGR